MTDEIRRRLNIFADQVNEFVAAEDGDQLESLCRKVPGNQRRELIELIEYLITSSARGDVDSRLFLVKKWTSLLDDHFPLDKLQMKLVALKLYMEAGPRTLEMKKNLARQLIQQICKSFVQVDNPRDLAEFWHSLPDEFKTPLVLVVEELIRNPPAGTDPAFIERMRTNLAGVKRMKSR